jgi:uncharacterized surface protein with fasciclin (FAS1) repeats
MANLLETATQNGSCKTLLTAVEKAALKSELESPGSFTLTVCLVMSAIVAGS